jgi:photosystem II stability/assembly factor-like uncharacterized protein
MNKTFFLFFLIAPTLLFSQKKNTKTTEAQPPYTLADVRIKSFDQRKKLEEVSLVSQVRFRNAGPTVMSGRVTDLDANPQDPSEFYVAYASGGLWYSNNNGVSFKPVFDQEAAMTIGDIAVDWSRKIIWVGTGENNSSRSSYSGVGVFKSTDGGKSWTNMGLGESHHIGRIVMDPDNPDLVYVAVLGHLYSSNKERGIYKTADGGKTWKQTLFVNDTTGCIDLVMDPGNKNNLYAAAWDRSRRAWNFSESGKSSGIYKSTDGGETWKLVTTGTNGIPIGAGTGRIGLAASSKNGSTVIYAFLDNQFRRDKKKEEDTIELKKDQLRDMSGDIFQNLDKKRIENFLSNNGFPEKYTADTVLSMVKQGIISPKTLVEYLEDANSLLFSTDVTGAELYRSDDGGATWYKPYKDYMEDLFYTYGYYFAQVRAERNNPDKVYLVGFVILKSDDGGKTFKNINGENVHVDHHALWLDPARSGHLINGNDGGVNISYDDGSTWIKCNNPPVGQFYSVNCDLEKPYHLFGGLQDNGVWYGSSDYTLSNEWHQTGEYAYKEIMSGDGMQVAIDTRGNNVVYTGYQFGNYFRCNLLTKSQKYITPQHDLGERPYRWNWQSPIQLSTHNQDIVYFGANRLFRSLNRGDDFKPISPDLTKGGRKGDVPYGTITSLHESSLKFGLIYTGSDDGLVYVTRDGGNSWTKISDKLPKDLWVSRLQASKFAEGRVYASLSGYRWDDFNPYLYTSSDYGTSWTRIGMDLPLEPINVVREDPVNENVLYVGTDNGCYVSLDRGKSFMRMTGGLPSVAVHDLVIHAAEHDLILGTHGRSIYIASVKELQQLQDSILKKTLHLFAIDSKKYSNGWGQRGFHWDTIPVPEIRIPVYLNNPSKVQLRLYADSNLLIKTQNYDGIKGLNYLAYDLSIDSTILSSYEQWLNKEVKAETDKVKVKKADNGIYYLRPGKYRCVVETNGVLAERTLTIDKPR